MSQNPPITLDQHLEQQKMQFGLLAANQYTQITGPLVEIIRGHEKKIAELTQQLKDIQTLQDPKKKLKKEK